MPAKRREKARQPRVLVVLGNQLFAPEHLPGADDLVVFMAEDTELCTFVRHHQQKIVLYLSAMRHHAQALRAAGYDVHYHALEDDGDTPF